MQNMENIARNHHFLPAFYLAGFTPAENKDDFLYVLDLEAHKQWRVRPQNAGAVRDFNLINIPEVRPDIIEKQVLSPFEARVASILLKIFETKSLPKENAFIDFLNFIALLAIRNPTNRAKKIEFYEEKIGIESQQFFSSPEVYKQTIDKVKDILREEGKNLPEDIPYTEMKRFIEETRYKIEIPTITHILHEFDIITFVVSTLLERKWTIVVSNEGNEFICSDHPVALLSTLSDQRPSKISDFGMKNTLLTFPLNKNIAVIGKFEGESTIINADSVIVNKINGLTALFAKRYLYSAKREFTLILENGRKMNSHEMINAKANNQNWCKS